MAMESGGYGGPPGAAPTEWLGDPAVIQVTTPSFANQPGAAPFGQPGAAPAGQPAGQYPQGGTAWAAADVPTGTGADAGAGAAGSAEWPAAASAQRAAAAEPAPEPSATGAARRPAWPPVQPPAEDEPDTAGAGARQRSTTQLPPGVLQRGRWASMYPESKGVPQFHWQANPSGYKIFVGDLPEAISDNECWLRIFASCDQAQASIAFEKILTVKVTTGRADSGSAYVVITVSDYSASEVTQLQEQM